MPVLRSIVHMDLDTFFVSCERLLDSRLVGKPILIGGTSDRGVVASCSINWTIVGIFGVTQLNHVVGIIAALQQLVDLG